MKKVAFFDIDGTIFRSSLLIEITEALIQEGIFPTKAERMYADSYSNWLNRKDSYEKYINDVICATEKYIVGVPRSQYAKVAKRVVAFHKDRVYRYTRNLVHALKKKGYYVIAISHSPKDMVDEFCKNMGFDRSYGRVYELDGKKRFTGVTHLELYDDKAELVKHLVKTEGFSLKGSVGVGDSEGDITLLKLVEKPICFNPNKKLFDHAKKAGWEIVVERKDMVYHLH